MVGRRWIGLERKPDVRGPVSIKARSAEARRKYANHFAGLLLDRDDAAHQPGIATETSAPQAIADHCHTRTSIPIFVGGKRSPDFGMRTEQSEIVR
jgi:hypothetical protein